jgi:hypothetical protein
MQRTQLVVVEAAVQQATMVAMLLGLLWKPLFVLRASQLHRSAKRCPQGL